MACLSMSALGDGAEAQAQKRGAATSLDDSRRDDETEALLQLMLTMVHGRSLEKFEVAGVLGACPELSWLGECAEQCPLPPGWSRSRGLDGQTKASSCLFKCELTGEVSSMPPHLLRFVALAHRMLRVVQCPDEAVSAASWIQQQADEALAERARVEVDWEPHIDHARDARFWHCAATGCSAWENPGAHADYFARVAKVVGAQVLAGCSASGGGGGAATPEADGKFWGAFKDVRTPETESVPSPSSKTSGKAATYCYTIGWDSDSDGSTTDDEDADPLEEVSDDSPESTPESTPEVTPVVAGNTKAALSIGVLAKSAGDTDDACFFTPRTGGTPRSSSERLPFASSVVSPPGRPFFV